MRFRLRIPGIGPVHRLNCCTQPQSIYTVRVLLFLLTVAGLLCLITIFIIESHSHTKWEDVYNPKFSHLKPDQPDDAPDRFKFPAIPTNDKDDTLNYGVVIDCGSSGSRAYVYYWPQHHGNLRELLQIRIMKDKNAKVVIKKIEPGISIHVDHPSRADEYLKPLLDFAAEHIPTHKHRETPLYILATAGMRLLPLSQQQAILDDIRVDVPLLTNFLFQDSHAEIISGKQEGVYAWITINYILGRLDHSSQTIADTAITTQASSQTNNYFNSGLDVSEAPIPHQRQPTVGIIDMGGASVQIAYEVPVEKVDKSLLAEFNLGCTKSDTDHIYRIYVSTFLGFGANSIRKHREESLLNTSASPPTGSDRQTLSPEVVDPCMPYNLKTVYSQEGRSIQVHGGGNLAGCMRRTRYLLNMTKSDDCGWSQCAMNGVHLPDHNNTEFYGFSEFYYTMEDVLRMAGPYERQKFHEAAQDYCGTSWATLQSWYKRKLYPKADENRFLYQCFKSAWMSLVLHEGFHFPRDVTRLTSAQEIKGQDTHWSLGAILYKTRYFPLGQIQHVPPHVHRRKSFLASLQGVTYFMLCLCVAIVCGAICLYLRRLRIVKRSDLRKIPSMAYFMTDESQMQDGVYIEKYFA